MNNELVTIIMSTYNRADRFLRPAIESALSQTHKNIELIIVDDFSTDGTSAVVAEFVKRDKRIRYIKTKQNTGTDARPKNMALRLAKGEYICYLDDDCEFLPYHVEKLLARMKKSPDVDIVYGDMWIYDADKPEDEGSQGISMNHNGQFLLNRNYIDTNAVMHKKEIAFRVGGWDETLPRFKDWNLWVRMMKAGALFQRVPLIITNYYTHKKNTAHKHPVRMWDDPETGMRMFEPTFSPAGCYIYLPYLGNDRQDEINPRVAVFTITYDRLEYTKRMHASMMKSTKWPITWFVFDNHSKDGTQDWVVKQTPFTAGSTRGNKGITFASNYLIDKILDMDSKMSANGFQIIIKIDNDCEFMTQGWLESIVDLWKRNHMFYLSPYPEGLVQNPGGGPRVGYSFIGPYFVEVATHIGGLFAAVDKRAYKNFRWNDQFQHGNQDREASEAFKKARFMPLYLPMHRIMHMDTTEGQQAKFPEYFERRKLEKSTKA